MQGRESNPKQAVLQTAAAPRLDPCRLWLSLVCPSRATRSLQPPEDAADDPCPRERQAEEQRKREANVAHKKKINRASLDAIIKETGISEDQGKSVLTAIISGLVPNVSINY